MIKWHFHLFLISLFFLSCQGPEVLRNPQSIKPLKEKIAVDDLLKRLSSRTHGVGLVGDLKKKFRGQKEVFLSSDFIKKNTITLTGNDPNFKDVGLQKFEGIPLTALLKHYGQKKTSEVTFIANDQYVSIEDKDFMKRLVQKYFE